MYMTIKTVILYVFKEYSAEGCHCKQLQIHEGDVGSFCECTNPVPPEACSPAYMGQLLLRERRKGQVLGIKTKVHIFRTALRLSRYYLGELLPPVCRADSDTHDPLRKGGWFGSPPDLCLQYTLPTECCFFCL